MNLIYSIEKVSQDKLECYSDWVTSPVKSIFPVPFVLFQRLMMKLMKIYKKISTLQAPGKLASTPPWFGVNLKIWGFLGISINQRDKEFVTFSK